MSSSMHTILVPVEVAHSGPPNIDPVLFLVSTKVHAKVHGSGPQPEYVVQQLHEWALSTDPS